MNKVYTLVWDPALGQIVVASELAKGRAKGGRRIRRALPLTLALASALAAPMSAWAADSVCVDPVTGLPMGTTDLTSGDEVACGNGASATGTNSIAIGTLASTPYNYATALGYNSRALGAQATIFGTSSEAGTDAVALGYDAHAVNGWSTAVGSHSWATNNIATAVGSTATASGAGSTALGSLANASGTYALAIMRGSQASGTNSIAIGRNAQATGNSNIAIGASASGVTGASYTISIGDGSKATTEAIALGRSSSASGAASIAMGLTTDASGADSVAIGNGAVALGAQSISIGTGNYVSGVGSGAIGDPNSVTGSGSYALGNNNSIARDNSFVVGNGVSVTQGNSVVLGNGSTDRAATTETDATIAGTTYTFAGQGSATNGVVSVGAVGAERQVINVAAGNVSATSTDAINGSQLYAANQAIAATDERAVKYDWTDTNGDGVVDPGEVNYTSVSMNPGGAPTTIHNVAAGVAPTDAVNVSQLTQTVAASATHYYSVNDGGVQQANYNNDGATGVNALAAGAGASASSLGSVAIGSNASSAGYQDNVAIGTSAVAGVGGFEDHLVAIGAGASATGGDFGTAIGANSVVTNSGAAIGGYASATGNSALAMGFSSSASGDFSTALGVFSSASAANGVALGSESVADSTANGVGYVPTGAGTAQANAIAATTKGTLAPVSVGNIDATRQIQNVAAGTLDSDAVNVAQLKSVATTVQGLDDRAVKYDWTDTDGDGVVDPGEVTYTSVTMNAGGAPTTIHNVAAGVAPTDAVNVSQLTQTVAASATHYYSVNDNGVQQGNYTNNGATGTNSVAVGTNAQSSGAQSVAIGDGAVATDPKSVALGSGSATAPVVATTSGVIAGTTYTYAGTAPVGTVSVGATGAERTITNVAAGRVSATSTDAVNGSQLNATNQAIDKLNTQVTNVAGDVTNLDQRVTNVEDQVVNITHLQEGSDGMFQVSQEAPIVKPTPTGTNSSAGGNGAVASGNNALAVGNQAKATGNNSTAVGTGATASATNSTALGQGSTASHANSVALGAGSQTTRGAQSNYNAAYVGNSSSTGEVNIGGRTMTGVAAGVQDTDAVNVSQLRSGVNYAIDQSKAYTDQRILGVQNDIWALDRGYRGATASAMAMAGLTQAYLPGKSMASVAFGSYQGEAGMAIGLSGTTENGRWVYKAQASGNTTRDWGFSVGAGIQW
ncbi:YadA-like family protein [Lysobacter terrae]